MRTGLSRAEVGEAVVQTIEAVRRRASGRVPPHNLEAEESLIGAMFLSRDAITAAVEAHVETSDFYKPAHGHIYEAIQSLHGQGEPADPVTVAEELRRADLARRHRRSRRAAPDPGQHARHRPTRATTRASSTSSRCCAG